MAVESFSKHIFDKAGLSLIMSGAGKWRFSDSWGFVGLDDISFPQEEFDRFLVEVEDDSL